MRREAPRRASRVLVQYPICRPYVLAGDSAGAYLALRAAEATRGELPPPLGCLLWCPFLFHHPVDGARDAADDDAGDFLASRDLGKAMHESEGTAHAASLAAAGVDDLLVIAGGSVQCGFLDARRGRRIPPLTGAATQAARR